MVQLFIHCGSLVHKIDTELFCHIFEKESVALDHLFHIADKFGIHEFIILFHSKWNKKKQNEDENHEYFFIELFIHSSSESVVSDSRGLNYEQDNQINQTTILPDF